MMCVDRQAEVFGERYEVEVISKDGKVFEMFCAENFKAQPLKHAQSSATGSR